MALRRWGALLLSDEGRLGRRRFWLFFLGCIVFTLAMLSLPVVGLPAVAPVVISLILIYPAYCIIARRLHDVGIDGQWGIFMAGIAAIDALWVAAGTGLKSSQMAGLIHSGWWWLSLANMLAFFALGLWPGERAANRFGPSLRAAKPGEDAAPPRAAPAPPDGGPAD